MIRPAGEHVLGDAGAASAELPREAVGPGPTSLSTRTGQDSRGRGGEGGSRREERGVGCQLSPALCAEGDPGLSRAPGERGSAGSGFGRGKAGPAQAAPCGPTGLSCPSLKLALHTHHFWVSWVSESLPESHGLCRSQWLRGCHRATGDH